MNKFFYWTIVILWMAFIFYLSNQPATESDKLSIGITEVIIENVEKVAPNTEFDISKINHIIRKNAHFFAYLILGVFIINAMRRSAVNGYRIFGLALLICVLYAISDEVHQLFVPGRGPGVKDVLIDSAGATLGIGAYLIIGRLMNKTR